MAWLENRADFAQESFADKYLVGRGHERWYYIKVDGWTLSFWDEEHYDPHAAEHGHIYPAAWLDLRLATGADARFAKGGLLEVLVHMRSGRFLFKVATPEDAEAWVRCVRTAMVEHQALAMRLAEEAADRAAVDQAATVQGVVPGRVVRVAEAPRRAGDEDSDDGGDEPVTGYRAQVLRQLWVQCLRTAAHGETPQVFNQMFDLYDLDASQVLSIRELEHLLKDLISVRKHELAKSERRQMMDERHVALAVSEAELKEQEEVGAMAKELSKHYRNMLKGTGFRSRATVLRAALDSSHDGRVTKGEFVRSAGELLLPGRELRMEAKYYDRVGKMMERAAQLRGEDDSEDEGGCIQQ